MGDTCEYVYENQDKRVCTYKKKNGGAYCGTHANKIKKNVEIKSQENISLKDRILLLHTTTKNKQKLLRHYNNLKRLDTSSVEYYKNYAYLESCLMIPWGTFSHIDTKLPKRQVVLNVKSVLDNSVYGMESVKQEILNYTCRMMTNPSSTRNILGLYGLAGSGKTRIAHAISEAIQRPIKCISLGGIKDVSYFLGHNYVYVESGPGVITQSLTDTRIMNPILYFDELDKISDAKGGQDIHSFLMYLTDPIQNNKFLEHYFNGITFDLSKTFFIFTFNDISKIDKVLLDRINLIHIPDLSIDEKVKILKDYCFPEILLNVGIPDTIQIDEKHFRDLVTRHGLDSQSTGIRELYRIIESICMEYNKQKILEPNTSFDFKQLINIITKNDKSTPNMMYI